MLATFLLASAAAAPPLQAAAETPARQGDRQIVLRLTPLEMLGAAERALASGQRETAAGIYQALEEDPDPAIRNEARFRRARLALAAGAITKAASLLRRILDERPDAAPVRLELARSLQLIGDTDSALRELRAAQAGGLPPAVARLVDRYSEALRAGRPLGASVEIALAPDSNINRATRSDTLGTVIGDFDIDPESKAASGLGLSLKAQAFRRLPLGKGDHGLLGRAGLIADLYGKSRFNDIAIDLAAGPELHLDRNRINIELGATARWFGQKPFLRSARVGARWTRPLGTRAQINAGASAALVDHAFNDLQDGKAFSAQAGIERALSPVTGVGLNLAVDRQSLKDPGYSTTAWRSTILGWRELGRTTLTVSASYGRLKADERLLLFPEKRSESWSRFALGATFRQLGVAGFAPVLRISTERNRSTIEFYDFRRTRTEVGIARSF